MRLFLLALIVLLLMLLAACGSAPRQPDLPGADMLMLPSLLTVERRHYVPVPGHLTEVEPVAVGEIAECFAVAAERRAAIVRANAKLREIGAIEGTEVAP